jgi:pyrimidine-nucleoside phosphorylase
LKHDLIDHAVGVVIHHKVGDSIKVGDPLFTLHANNLEKMAEARQGFLAAHRWSPEPVQALPLFYGVVE